MKFDFDEDLIEQAQKQAKERTLDFKFRVSPYDQGGAEWKVDSYGTEPKGWGSSPNEALQRFIDHNFSRQVKSKMEQFWEDGYSREKFEALNKFMEEYVQAD